MFRVSVIARSLISGRPYVTVLISLINRSTVDVRLGSIVLSNDEWENFKFGLEPTVFIVEERESE